MNVMVAVLIAWLASGEMNYAAQDVNGEEDCKTFISETALARLEMNKTEDDKVVAFSFKCIQFDRPAVSRASATGKE